MIDTGIDHGSVTVNFNSKKFELTTLREDIKTDGRYADKTNKFLERLQRKFTINAIYLNKEGKYLIPNKV